MRKSALHWLGHSFVIVVAALASACATDASVNPVDVATTARGTTGIRDESAGNRLPDLSACPALAAPVGSTLVLQAFGGGVQSYHWNGPSWGGRGTGPARSSAHIRPQSPPPRRYRGSQRRPAG